MGNNLWILLLALCALVTTSRACGPGPSRAPDPKISTPRVISANVTVTHGDFPHQVSLQATNKQNEHFCSASIIHPKFLLSAAHCFDGTYQLPYIRAVAGEHDLLASDGNNAEQIRRVIRLIKHENYNGQTHEHDIALLELNERLHFDKNRYVRPIALWDSKWELPRIANISGWEMYSYGPLPQWLLRAEVMSIDRNKCGESLKRANFTMTSKMICTHGFRDACQGDSSDPMTCSKDLAKGREQSYLCGIASFTIDCKMTYSRHSRSVFTDVSKYNEWIHRELPPTLYFGAERGEGISAFLEPNGTNRTLIRSAEDPEGLTFNWVTGKFYYAEANRIYSADEDGDYVQKVFESKLYGPIKGLAVDWITGNLYGVSRYGFVFVCKTPKNEQLTCTYLLSGQGNLLGIALDPNNGQMYWTSWPDKIMRAGMDGSEVVQVLYGRDHPVGITIDFKESRLFWTEYGSHNICSSALDGTDVFVVADRETETDDGGLAVKYPWGIAVHNDEVYWGNFHDNSLQRGSKWGGEIETLLTGQGHIQQLTTTQWNIPITRGNDCQGTDCGHICVLTPGYYSCVR